MRTRSLDRPDFLPKPRLNVHVSRILLIILDQSLTRNILWIVRREGLMREMRIITYCMEMEAIIMMMPAMGHLLASLKDDIGLSLLCQPSCHCQTRRSRTYDEIFCMYRSRHAFLLIWGEFIPFPPILVLQKITINLRKYKFSFSFHSPNPSHII